MRYLTPGPTQLHPAAITAIRQALDESVCSISHRSSAFNEMYQHAEKGVREVLSVPDDWYVFFLSSATEAMECLSVNCVDHASFHLTNGSFSERFQKIAHQLGKTTHTHAVPWGEGFALEDVKTPEECELISLPLNETSTGVWTPYEQIEMLRTKTNALIALDIVSAAPYATIPWNHIDATFFSVQKGFGMPAGLGVLFVNERCMKKAATQTDQGKPTGSFHSFSSLQKNAEKFSTPETPNVLNIFVLGQVCDALIKEGVDQLRQATEAKAKLVYDYLESSEHYAPFVQTREYRSPTTIVATAPDPARVLNALKENNITLGSGYADLKSSTFRVANFPMHTMEDMEMVIDTLQSNDH